tara:strand:- start:2592 stop:3245 length:654 start_codon:yes stop_codon:yes gene_type:complete
MNIFALSKCPEESAKQMIDKHVIKMPTETCQMLHTNILYMQYVHVHGKEPKLKDLKVFHKEIGSNLMKPAMLNHPSTIWARQSIANFHWLYQHGMALCEEYTYRYNKVHASQDRIIIGMRQREGINYSFPVTGLTPVTIAMFDKFRIPNTYDKHCWKFVIDSYRHYYLEGKWKMAEWKEDRQPKWWPKNYIKIKWNKEFEALERITGKPVTKYIIEE